MFFGNVGSHDLHGTPHKMATSTSTAVRISNPTTKWKSFPPRVWMSVFVVPLHGDILNTGGTAVMALF
jgi:hypothetical protein